MKTLLFIVLFSVTAFQGTVQSPLSTPLLAWHPDGDMIAVAWETELTILDAATLEPLNTISEFENIGDIAWSPDGERLAIADLADVQIWLHPWDAQDAVLQVTYKYYDPANPPPVLSAVNTMAWSPDGAKIASVAGEMFDVWDTASGQLIQLVSGDWYSIPDITWTSDNGITVGNLDALVRVIDPDTGEIIKFFHGAPGVVPIPAAWALSFSPDHDQLAVGMSKGLIEIWGDTRTTERSTRFSTLTLRGHKDIVLSVAWNPNPDFPLIASSSQDGTVRIWDAETGDLLETIKVGNHVFVESVAWKPDGSQLAYGDGEGQIHIVQTDSILADR